MERPFSEEDLINFYVERLGSISSRKELEEALKEGKVKEVDLQLNLDDFVSPKRQKEILEGNPDFIEILGVNRRVEYRYDNWNKKFIAAVKIPASEVLKLKEMPTLPSGRNLTFEVISKEGESYTQFSGTNLEELKQKSRQFLIKKQWDEWRHSEKAAQGQPLENFDLFGELPQLPEPVQFGTDPETGEPLFAYPAIAIESSYYSGNKYIIRFFPSQEEATRAQAKVLEIIEQAKTERRKKEERERLLVPTRELLQQVKRNLDTIGYDYENFGLSYEEKENIKKQIWQAEDKLESDTKEAWEILQGLNERLTQAFEYMEKRNLAKEKAEAAISEYYHLCPLCGQPMENGECFNSEHDTERIDYPLDEEGNEIGPAVLSQIVTDQGKIVAQLRCSHGEGRGRYKYYRGDVYLVFGHSLEESGWQGEPFESLHFEDFKKILTVEEAKKRRVALEALRHEKELAEARARYQEELEYAKQQVKEGYWRQGKFSKGKHPKTGEEQWELTIKDKGLVIKYIVDRWSRQPTSENEIYFYSESRTLVDTRGFRLILVTLERPFPEDKPEESSHPSTPEETSSSQSFAEKLEELKKKWNKK